MQVQRACSRLCTWAANLMARSPRCVAMSGLLLLLAAATLKAVESADDARRAAPDGNMTQTTSAEGVGAGDPACAPPKYYRCKIKTETKPIKKWVYECKLVPYCLHRPSKPFATQDSGCCPACEDCPRFKRVLIKREIVVGEKCETKCVPEEVPANCP